MPNNTCECVFTIVPAYVMVEGSEALYMTTKQWSASGVPEGTDYMCLCHTIPFVRD